MWISHHDTSLDLLLCSAQGGEATTRTMGGEERQATKVSGGNSALLVAFVGRGRFNKDDKRMKKKIQ
jgi:hypothetical protein